MLQKTIQVLLDYLCEFAMAHPNVVWTLFGCLCALALIGCVVAINYYTFWR